ncbi:MAG: hypothetical protein ACOC80_10860 [Petrotogales bacterium]
MNIRNFFRLIKKLDSQSAQLLDADRDEEIKSIILNVFPSDNKNIILDMLTEKGKRITKHVLKINHDGIYPCCSKCHDVLEDGVCINEECEKSNVGFPGCF